MRETEPDDSLPAAMRKRKVGAARRKDEKMVLDDGSPGSFSDLTSDITPYMARCHPLPLSAVPF